MTLKTILSDPVWPGTSSIDSKYVLHENVEDLENEMEIEDN